jgi:hypothetical protein
MKAGIVAIAILAGLGVNAASAQNNGNLNSSAIGSAAHANPASAGEAMGQPQSGGKSAAGDQKSLMEQRQKARSPQGASSGPATGTMKQ